MNKLPILKESNIASFIYFLRGEKVMIDHDLAKLYAVETRVLKQAVRRNINRFPDDFMFELTDDEIDLVVSQKLIPSKKFFGGARPFAFSEQGVAMLSSILNSDRAIQVNIVIMRTFVKLRQLQQDNKDIVEKIEKLEQKYDKQFKVVFTALQQLIKEENEPRPKVGFKQTGK
jgi:ORF6N domain